jgi:hypothetical protein
VLVPGSHSESRGADAERGELQELPSVEEAAFSRVGMGVGAAIRRERLHNFECTQDLLAAEIAVRSAGSTPPPTIPA